MFKSNFKLALRYIAKHKISSAINIFGLSIGLASCLLIALYIKHEISYDNFEEKGNRIARVIMEYSFDGGSAANKGNYTSVRVGPVFTKNFPEVESALIMTDAERVIQYQDKLISEKRFMYADSNFFDVFTFHLLQGDPHKVISAPNQVVVTESAAKKYFGTENAIGKLLKVGNDSNLYQVTGVMQDCPSNSQIKFDFLASFSSLGITKDYYATYWDANYTTFLLLKHPGSAATLQAKLPAFMKKEMSGQGATVNFYLEPFNSIHLHSTFGGFEPNNNITYIYILAAVALLILIIACSTYINLSTAKSFERAKEVGVRKLIGAGKQQLFWQFIGDSSLLCITAVTLSLGVSALVLPAFNELTGKQLALASLFAPAFLFFSLLVAAAVSFLAGSYPALVLTAYNPSKVLKGAFKNSVSGRTLRKSLIVFQFAISVFLIVSTFAVQQQLSFIQHKNLGYNREHVLVLPMDYSLIPKLPLIKQEFRSNPDVLNLSRCVRSPLEGGGGYNMRNERMPSSQQIAVIANPVDEDYLPVMGMQLIAGENFSESDIKDVTGDKQEKFIYHFILNESAAKMLGWSPQEAVGKRMYLDNSRPGFVKGVVKDFHFETLHNPIKPFVLFPEIRARELLVKISGFHLPETLAFLESKWKALVPGRPFEYRFMDNDYDALYSSEIRLGKVLNLFAGIAIALACLGLFGLSSYAAQERMKEIGIRKVLGASLVSIIIQLSRGFIVLAALAVLIAFPLAWWMTTNWLQDFTYRTNISWQIYGVAGMLTFLLALFTVSIHAIRAGMVNPVKSLRSE